MNVQCIVWKRLFKRVCTQIKEATIKVVALMYYLHRIAKYDQGGPRLNSILEINPDAIFIAEGLDFERKTKGSRGPLHGIPVVLKDNIETFDSMHTSAGSIALENHIASKDQRCISC
jgi:amidase